MGDVRDDEETAAAFLDLPYNVPMRSIGGRGSVKHAKFAFASGEMSRAECVRFLTAGLEQAARVSRPGAIQFVCMDGKHIRDLVEAGEAAPPISRW